jgi:hypothetical protein
MFERKTWRGYSLNYIANEHFVLSLLKYRASRDRVSATNELANIESSHVVGSSLHAPIIDLDQPHSYVSSSTPGHGHLYLNVPTTRARMFLLLLGLRATGNLERGTFWWSIRRGATFVRPPGVYKSKRAA